MTTRRKKNVAKIVAQVARITSARMSEARFNKVVRAAGRYVRCILKRFGDREKSVTTRYYMYHGA